MTIKCDVCDKMIQNHKYMQRIDLPNWNLLANFAPKKET